MVIHPVKKITGNLINLSLLTGILLLNACSQTPLQQLADDHLHNALNSAYWAKQQDEKTTLWTEAISYCKQHTEKPNCSAVMEVFVITNGSTEAPAIGHSGHSIYLP